MLQGSFLKKCFQIFLKTFCITLQQEFVRNEISSDNEIKPNGLCNLLISCCLDRRSPLKIHFILSFSNKDPTRRGWGVVKYSFVWDRQTFRVEENFYFSCCIWFELQARLQYEKLHLPLPILSFLIKHFWPCPEVRFLYYTVKFYGLPTKNTHSALCKTLWV